MRNVSAKLTEHTDFCIRTFQNWLSIKTIQRTHVSYSHLVLYIKSKIESDRYIRLNKDSLMNIWEVIDRVQYTAMYNVQYIKHTSGRGRKWNTS